MNMALYKKSRECILAITLLPILFVTHHIQRFYPFLTVSDIWMPGIKYLGISISTWIIYFVLVRNCDKVNLLTLFTLFIFFFFNPIHSWIYDHFGHYIFGQYRFLLPALLLFGIWIFMAIKKAASVNLNIIRYIHVVSFLFILIDILIIFQKDFNPTSTGPVQLVERKPTAPIINSAKHSPDIYLLIFDELGNSHSIRNHFGFNNFPLDSQLVEQGFHIIPGSRSNYYWTQFSVASLLNMEYLEIPNQNALTFDDYVGAMNLIKNNRLLEILVSFGYSINNCSPFDLKGNPAIIKYTANNFGISEMDRSTFFNTIQRDIGWKFRGAGTGITDTMNVHNDIEFAIKNQELTTNLVIKASRNKGAVPQFTYGHFFYTHGPFVYDSSGKVRKAENTLDDNKESRYISAYLNSLPVARDRIVDLVKQIKSNSAREAVIIVMGDHGFRPRNDTFADSGYFENFMAILPPGHKHYEYPHTVTAVNQFRLVLNSFLNCQFAVLPDSVIYLHDK